MRTKRIIAALATLAALSVAGVVMSAAPAIAGTTASASSAQPDTHYYW